MNRKKYVYSIFTDVEILENISVMIMKTYENLWDEAKIVYIEKYITKQLTL